jgi:hypothetical protein
MRLRRHIGGWRGRRYFGRLGWGQNLEDNLVTLAQVAKRGTRRDLQRHLGFIAEAFGLASANILQVLAFELARIELGRTIKDDGH